MSGSRRAVVAAISSHVVRGTVGNRAAVFALQAMGHRVWAVPTVVMPFHPGHGASRRLLGTPADLASLLGDLTASPFAAEVDAVLTGYMADPGQVAEAAGFIEALRARRPGLFVVVDPVMGDAGRLYVPEATAAAIRDRLVPLADAVTPNRTELAVLAGLAPDARPHDIPATLALTERVACPRVIVTSAPFGAGRLGAAMTAGTQATLCSHERLAAVPHGTGDLLAASWLGFHLAGLDAQASLRRSLEAVLGVARAAVAAGADELAPQDSAALFDPARRPAGPAPEPAGVLSVHYVEPPPLAGWDGEGLAGGSLPPADPVPPPVPVPPRLAAEARPDPHAGSGARRCVGVDGCPAGWLAVTLTAGEPPGVAVHASFAALALAAGPDALIAVDMPIGLPERIGPGGRGPEAAVRERLGARRSSVFSIPARAAIEAGSYEAACAAARAASEPPRAVSRQAFMLFPKIREIDALLRADPALAARVFEMHPELAFWRLAGGRAMAHPKKRAGGGEAEGLAERRAVLAGHGLPDALIAARPPRGAGADDLLDACAGALVAHRIAMGLAEPFPAAFERDAHGLPIAIWA